MDADIYTDYFWMLIFMQIRKTFTKLQVLVPNLPYNLNEKTLIDNFFSNG